ncbi:MAG: HAD-IIIA family hydrolase [Deltaproteobacteria bacterium]|nr:HAD-IIIA family hydrolase [Deltaproteobacteria bacterium]MBW2052350.1 HAD-IIIA family hydrolase [Deltaproteobacteria bacterium]MBW2139795.1 HAD-IIIA family hydrolase [Deltaproteobacteria bacterium]MBW2322843.1 HAD-IIIA family hydrolase [Deltaproteobacteria bacterium]
MGYINHLDRFRLLPGVGSAIARLNQAGLAVVVASNQSGVARGYFPKDLVDAVNKKMKDLLARDGAKLDGIYYCPHHPQAEVHEYRKDCECRKPRPGLIEKATARLKLDLARSFSIGDRLADIKTGQAAGTRNILVLSGYGRGELEYLLPNSEVRPDFVAEDLSGAVDWILKEI